MAVFPSSETRRRVNKTFKNENIFLISHVNILELFAHVVNDAAIEFPPDDDWPLEANSKDLITSLLQQSPQDRLGSAGPQEVKEHPYLADLDWNSLLRYKAEFIPRLENEEDTSYFDTRVDRYNHEFDDTDTDDSPVLASK